MLYTDGMTRQMRLGVLVAVVVVLLGGLAQLVWADILVSDLTGKEVRKFTDAGVPIPPVPFFIPGGGQPAGGEGLACLRVGGTFLVFTANEGPTINIYNLATGAFVQTFATSPRPGARYAGLSLSLNGSILYVADEALGFIDAYNTSTPGAPPAFSSAFTLASHDVRVGPDGSVYATHFANNTGVLKFTADLTSFTQFINPGNNGLNSPSGMAFDTAGNFWVANFDLLNNGSSAVYEFSPTGLPSRPPLHVILNPPSNILWSPVGLDFGPDGNLYVAAVGDLIGGPPTRGNDIAQINTTTFTVSSFIPNPFTPAPNIAGINPKYLLFTENCIIPPTITVLQDEVPGSMLIFPLFDCTAGNDTKIRITNGGVLTVNVRLTFVCAPVTQPTTGSAFCNMSDESFPFTPHQTRVFDVCAEIGGATATCPSGQGYVIAFAERRCDSTGTGCLSQNGSAIAAGEVAPISWNTLIGSYFIYSQIVPPPAPPPATCVVGGPGNPVGCVAGEPEPDVEGAKAIAIQSPQAALTFLGTDIGPGSALNLTFGTTASDYAALPRTLNTDFAAVGGTLGTGPAAPFPGPRPGAITGTELATNFILLNLNAILESANALTRVAINVWNWFEVPFTVSNQFVCWERIPGFLPVGSPPVPFIDPHFGVALLGSDYGNARFTPITSGGVTPALLGAVEEISTFGRTIRNMFHTGASAATLTTDVEGP